MLPDNEKIFIVGRREMRTEERLIHWQTVIDNQAASGKNIADYCRESNIRTSGFYTWRRKLREQQSVAQGFIELKANRRSDTTSGIRIRLGAKLAIEVERGFDPFTLRAVVEALSKN
jgi:hypothetical protein